MTRAPGRFWSNVKAVAYKETRILRHDRAFIGVIVAQPIMMLILQGAVLSNKPAHPSRAIVQALGLGQFFPHVCGGDSFPTKKPDPEGARALLKENKTQPQDALIVGDSSVDVLTGRNAGMWTCGVTYGFAPHTLCEAPPDVVLDHPHELTELFA